LKSRTVPSRPYKHAEIIFKDEITKRKPYRNLKFIVALDEIETQTPLEGLEVPDYFRILMTLAGIPTATELAGMSPLTTAPAPVIAPSPIVDPLKTVTPFPIQTFLPI
jgi:hypothetical protein